MSFELVEAEKGRYPNALMCRALGLSRSGYHAFTIRKQSARSLDTMRLDVDVAATFATMRGRYGSPRIQKELRSHGRRTSKKRVAASMARQGLVARPKRRWNRTTDSNHREPIAPNLLARRFEATEPNRIWVGDTTYLPVNGGFIYLLVILDLFSRKVVGWAVSDRLDAELSCEALRRAIAKRHPQPGWMFHSDRGHEFAASSFRAALKASGAIQSMSRKGNCWDNAVSESFFSTLEFEMEPSTLWQTTTEAEPELFNFIEGYYNATRLHSKNNYRSPNETEFTWRVGALAA